MAIAPPHGELHEFRRALPAGARLTRTGKWHVTVLFLGAVADGRGVVAALGRVEPPGPFTLRLTGGGRFGTVHWAGVDGDPG